MAGFLDPVRPIEQGPGWNWNPGQTFVTAMKESQAQKAALEKNALDMEMNQILMPYKVQKAALELDKLEADSNYLAAHTALYREQSAVANQNRLSELDAQRNRLNFQKNSKILNGGSVGGSLIPEDVGVMPTEAMPATSPSARVTDPNIPTATPVESVLGANPSDAELDAQVAAMPNSNAVQPTAQDLSSDPNGLMPPANENAVASANPLNNLTDSVDAPRDIFASLPDADTGLASTDGMTPTAASSMAANSQAIDKARAGEFMSGRPTQVQTPSSMVDPERDAYLKESDSTLAKIARGLPDAPSAAPAKADANSGLNNLFQNYRDEQRKLMQLEATAPTAKIKNDYRGDRLALDAAARAQAEQNFGVPGVKGGAFDAMVQMDSAKLNAVASQKTADNSWNDIVLASRKVPKAGAGATDEKLEERIGKLTEASSKVADNDNLKRQIEENTALLAKRQNMELRGLTPQQAQQEEFQSNQGYMQNLIGLHKQGSVDAYGQPLTSKSVTPKQEIYSLANKGMIPTFQVVPNQDGTMKFAGVGAQALTKMPQGTLFAARDPKGTMSILSRDTNSASGFTPIDMGGPVVAKKSSAPEPLGSDNPFYGKTAPAAIENPAQKQFEDDELSGIDARLAELGKINQMNPQEYQLYFGNKNPASFGVEWNQLLKRKNELSAAQQARTSR